MKIKNARSPYVKNCYCSHCGFFPKELVLKGNNGRNLCPFCHCVVRKNPKTSVSRKMHKRLNGDYDKPANGVDAYD